MRYFVTGGAGFIGSNFVRYLLRERPDADVVTLDALTYAGHRESLADVLDHPRHDFVHGDICDGQVVQDVIDGVDTVFNLAAETHVDRSIVADAPFVRTNVLGTATLLAAALEKGVRRFVQVSTDEVYGELPWWNPEEEETPHGDATSSMRAQARGSATPDEAIREPPPRFTEETPLAPRSPYAATKAGADQLALAYHTTHGLDVVVTRCSNNYGPYQFPEKLIPVVISHARRDEPVPVYGDGLYVRDWIAVEDHCRGLLLAAERGAAGRVYNFGGDSERTNLSVVRAVLAHLGKPESLVGFVEDRPGHDRRYAVDFSRATAELGWAPTTRFDEGLARTVAWYVANDAWCEAVAT